MEWVKRKNCNSNLDNYADGVIFIHCDIMEKHITAAGLRDLAKKIYIGSSAYSTQMFLLIN